MINSVSSSSPEAVRMIADLEVTYSKLVYCDYWSIKARVGLSTTLISQTPHNVENLARGDGTVGWPREDKRGGAVALKYVGRWRLLERSTLPPLDIVRSVTRLGKLLLEIGADWI